MGERTEVSIQHDFPVSADRLYELLGDFTNLSWVPPVPKVEFEGEGPGMTRFMYFMEDGPATVEILESLDPVARKVAYCITENNPLQVDDYHATMQITETGPETCRLDWGCSFIAGALPPEVAVPMVEQFYRSLLPEMEKAAIG